MSEKIYALLLRLYPAHFRRMYGEEALQLVRDRMRDEQGLWAKARLWRDLLADFAKSAPREYGYVPTELAVAAAGQRVGGVPSFWILDDEPMRAGTWVWASVVSLMLVGTSALLMDHAGGEPLGAFAGSGSNAAGQVQWVPKQSGAGMPQGDSDTELIGSSVIRSQAADSLQAQFGDHSDATQIAAMAAGSVWLGTATTHALRAQTPSVADNAKVDLKGLTGQWQGTLPAQPPGSGSGQRVVFQVSKADGGWKTVFNFIDLIARGLGVPRPADLTLQGSMVQIAVPGNGGKYRGQLSADGNTIVGTWTQGGPEVTLTLLRATPETAWDVPKPPVPMKPMAPDANPAFDVATIKPNPTGGSGNRFGMRGRNFSTSNTSLEDLIVFAYDVHAKQILDGPAWIHEDKYDITAVPDAEGAPSNQQWKIMVQKLLADRFQLAFHHEKRELNVYILSVAKGGPKNLKKSDSTTSGFFIPIRNIPGGFTMPARNAAMSDLTSFALQGAVLDRPVLDQTGIVGLYDFTLTWAPVGTEFGGAPPSLAPTDNPPPNLFTAIQDQLGLKLEAVKTPADVMVIDKAEKPSPN
jgi:uncharacterized protein (TIGR03435 family)